MLFYFYFHASFLLHIWKDGLGLAFAGCDPLIRRTMCFALALWEENLPPVFSPNEGLKGTTLSAYLFGVCAHILCLSDGLTYETWSHLAFSCLNSLYQSLPRYLEKYHSQTHSGNNISQFICLGKPLLHIQAHGRLSTIILIPWALMYLSPPWSPCL